MRGKVRNKDPILVIGHIIMNKQNIQLAHFNELKYNDLR